MLTFSELVLALATGKRVTQPHWTSDYICFKEGKIVSKYGHEYRIQSQDDWIIQDKISMNCIDIFGIFKYSGVKYIKVVAYNNFNCINLLHQIPANISFDTLVEPS